MYEKIKHYLPSGWVLAKISDICDPINGKAFKPSDWKSKGLPIIRIQNLKDPLAKYNYFDGEIEEKYIVEKEDLLFAWSGTPGTSFGAFIWKGNRSVLNQHIFRIEYNTNYINSEYFCYTLNNNVRDYIREAQGGVGLAHITKAKFVKSDIPLPPLNEQKRIVAKIEALFARSQRIQEKLDQIPRLLERLRKSILAAAFRGDLTAEWRQQNPDVEPASQLLERIRQERRQRWETEALAKMQAKGKPPKNDQWKTKYKEPEPVNTDGLPTLPEGWCWVKLEYIIKDGPTNGYSPKTGNDAQGSKILKLSATTKGMMLINENTIKRAYNELPSTAGYWLEPGDILIQRANSLQYLGATAVYDGPKNQYVYPDLMMRIRVTESSLRKLLWLYFNGSQGREYFRNQAIGTAGNMPKINGKTVKEMIIPLPPLSERNEIVDRVTKELNSIEKLRHYCEEVTNKKDKFNQSILAKAFRGELVPQDPRDEPASVLLERIRKEREAPPPKKAANRPRKPVYRQGELFP